MTKINYKRRTQNVSTLRILKFQSLYHVVLRDLREFGPRKHTLEEATQYLLGLEVAGRILGIPVSDNPDDLAFGTMPPPK